MSSKKKQVVVQNVANVVRCAGIGMLVALTLPAAANAARPTTAVVLGDSYMSGEGGRWKGNSLAQTGSSFGNKSGTDIARTPYNDGPKPETLAYMKESFENGCNRSLYSPGTYLNATDGMPAKYDVVRNFACSGARTKHIKRLVDGGSRFKGELPQLDQLAAILPTHDVKLIVLGAGGNDVGFGGAVSQCALSWFVKHWTVWDGIRCENELRDDHGPKLAEMQYNLVRTIEAVRATMAAAGQADYKIVLMGAPNPLPGWPNWKYSEGDRRDAGCPITGDDARYIDDRFVPKLNGTFEAVAHQTGVDFINTDSLFNGHRLCEAGTVRPDVAGFAPAPDPRTSEWVRRLDKTMTSVSEARYFLTLDGFNEQTNYRSDQGTFQESFHPNFYGQKALGHCIREYVENTAASPKRFACTPGASKQPNDVALTALKFPTQLHGLSDKAIPDFGATSMISTLYANTEQGQVMRNEIQILHLLKGTLSITLTNPNGKAYVLKSVNPDDNGAFPSTWRTFHYDVPAISGTWTLKINDTKADGKAGTFLDWKGYFY